MEESPHAARRQRSLCEAELVLLRALRNASACRSRIRISALRDLFSKQKRRAVMYKVSTVITREPGKPLQTDLKSKPNGVAATNSILRSHMSAGRKVLDWWMQVPLFCPRCVLQSMRFYVRVCFWRLQVPGYAARASLVRDCARPTRSQQVLLLNACMSTRYRTAYTLA